IGPHLDRHWPPDFKTEKKYFGRLNSRGTIKKINYAARLAGLKAFSEHERPLKTIVALRELRHALAHARPGREQAALTELASSGFAAMALRDVEELAEALHAATLRTLAERGPSSRGAAALGPRAFGGPAEA
ncbi:MAG: hypothetical protein ACLGQW_09790, partial [Acidobacteriota bacterium]